MPPPAGEGGLDTLRLREFLDLTTRIDFGAKLVTDGGVSRFADKNLEQKSREWRFCFRAGKPAVDAARAFAQAWLAEGRP